MPNFTNFIKRSILTYRPTEHVDELEILFVSFVIVPDVSWFHRELTSCSLRQWHVCEALQNLPAVTAHLKVSSYFLLALHGSSRDVMVT